jgi:ribose transport system ATP-binding protein
MTAERTGKKQPVLRMTGITKRFPGVIALNDVSLECYAGEVHAIVGENGAGKSTLMKILVGAHQPDAGTIYLQGNETDFQHPRFAQMNGLSIIYQEFTLLPERTVAQNIFLGREPLRFGFVDNQTMIQRTKELLNRLKAGSYIHPNQPVKQLSIAEQQIVEIAKALSFEARILVMDEPTAALTTSEIDILFDIMTELLQQGMAIIYISHRFNEIFRVANRVTVLKDGEKVATRKIEDVTSNELVRLMVGREFDEYYPAHASPEDIGEVLLEVQGGANDFLSDIHLRLRRGEIISVAGLQGSGRTELARALFGLDPFTSGILKIRGTPVEIRSARQAIQHKMGFVTEDRKQEGLNLQQSVEDNVLLPWRALKGIFKLLGRHNQKDAGRIIKRFDVKTAGLSQEVQFLSGGNQQKVVLSKWLAIDADILLFDEPTRGIDVSAKTNIHDIIRQLAKSGKAILMISSELPEVIGMGDRILVMREGTTAGELPADTSEAEIMLLATGEDNQP